MTKDIDDKDEFRKEVIERLKKLEGMFTSLFGNAETNDKGHIHWINEKIKDHNERLSSIEKIKIFTKGASWAIGLMFSTFAISVWEILKHIYHNYLK